MEFIAPLGAVLGLSLAANSQKSTTATVLQNNGRHVEHVDGFVATIAHKDLLKVYFDLPTIYYTFYFYTLRIRTSTISINFP